MYNVTFQNLPFQSLRFLVIIHMSRPDQAHGSPIVNLTAGSGLGGGGWGYCLSSEVGGASPAVEDLLGTILHTCCLLQENL